MHHLLAALLIIALHLPGQASPASLTCAIRPNRIGQPVCHCKFNRPGSRWLVYNMIVCTLTGAAS